MSLALAVALLNAPPLSLATITYLSGSDEPAFKEEFPFSRPTDGPARFKATSTLPYTIFSAGLIRIEPDDCVESVKVNDTEFDLPSDGGKCWPASLALDLSRVLRLGANRLEIEVSNTNGGHGVAVVSLHSWAAILSMFIAAAIGLAFAAPVISRRIRLPASASGRLAAMSVLPLAGALLIGHSLISSKGDEWVDSHSMPVFLAAAVALAALTRCLDGLKPTPIQLRPSIPFAVLAIAFFVAVASALEEDWGGYDTNAGIMAGLAASLFAVVPVREFVVRTREVPWAMVVAAVAVASPHVYWAFNLPLWGYLAPVTGSMVRGLLWLCGYETHTSFAAKRDVDGIVTDYYDYVSTPDFSVQIGSWCSGFEGVSLFLFLLAVFVLLDWRLFSRVRHLWAAFAITLPFMLAVNAVRIAGLMLYAEWNLWRYGRTQATAATIEAFHSHIGWVAYTLAFALFLPLVYRWGRRTATVK